MKKNNSLNEIGKFNHALYLHTIEHVADPISQLEKILQHINHICIETPYGIPKISFVNKSMLLLILFVLLSLNPKLWKNIPPLSVGLKSKVQICKQSEHINSFELETIEKIENLVNCDSCVRLSLANNTLGEKHQVIQVLFSKKQQLHTNTYSEAK